MDKVDTLARKMGVGCDYCGATTKLERYEASRLMAYGFRCVDARACNERELAQTPEDDD